MGRFAVADIAISKRLKHGQFAHYFNSLKYTTFLQVYSNILSVNSVATALLSVLALKH